MDEEWSKGLGQSWQWKTRVLDLICTYAMQSAIRRTSSARAQPNRRESICAFSEGETTLGGRYRLVSHASSSVGLEERS